MKKIISILLMAALLVCGVFSLASCKKDDALSKVSAMYQVSSPTKVIAVTKQQFSGYTLNSSYSILNGYVDNKAASVYISEVEEIHSVEEGGESDEIKNFIKKTVTKIEAIEGVGSRTNGGKWNADGNVWNIGKGVMAINLDKNYVVDAVYDNHKLSFTVPAVNTSVVFGDEYAVDMGSDVNVVIVDDGAVITSIELTYNTKVNEDSHVGSSLMNIKVDYTYDLEKVTIE